MTHKYVINTCYGGYSLSKKAYEYLGLEWDGYGFAFNDDRANSKLIECVEALGKDANGDCADLKIVEVMINVSVENKYDGIEQVLVDWYSES